MKQAVTRNHVLRFRVFRLEKKAIEQAAEASGHSVSEYLRLCALGKEIRFRLSDEEIEILKMLREYRNNFARISNLIKENKKGLHVQLKEIISGIDGQLKKLK